MFCSFISLYEISKRKLGLYTKVIDSPSCNQEIKLCSMFVSDTAVFGEVHLL